MSELLVHYAREPVPSVHSVKQQPEPDMKPKGLWLSVDSQKANWRAWCEGESFGLERLVYSHDVTLAPGANILRLGNCPEIDDFTRAFARAFPELPDRDGFRSMFIGWAEVAEHWDGIIISPYVYGRRLDGNARWYYSWDCASGCIWDAAAVASIALRVPA